MVLSPLMSRETSSNLEFSRREARPRAMTLSDSFLNLLSGFEECADMTLRGLEIPEGQAYAFTRVYFNRGGYAYSVTLGEGERNCEFGISRSRGDKVVHDDIESVTLYIDNVGASISYMKGRVGTTDGDSVRYVNSPNAVVGAYHCILRSKMLT